jgi:hypothetical protein
LLLGKHPHFQGGVFLANSAAMSHSDPVSEKSSLPKGLQVETDGSGNGPERGDKQQAAGAAGVHGGGASTTLLPPEIGGREGPEPTRFGDWEKSGRCIDF